MFQGVGGGAIKLSDMVPSPVDSGKTLAADEVSLTTMTPSRGQALNCAYRPYRAAAGKTKERLAGWYDLKTGTLLNGDSDVVQYGAGFMLQCDYPINLTFAGQVVQAQPTITAPEAGYYRTGNITPVPVSITNLVPVAVAAGKEVAADEVSIITYTKDRVMIKSCGYRPYRAAAGKTKERIAGWYDAKTGDRDTDTVFAAGEGFVLQCDYPITITLPDPIKAND